MGPSYKDYYKILGVAKNASEKEIKSAYRKLARKFHPDVNQNDKTAEEKFKDISEANDVLSDRDKRDKYDRFGDQWKMYSQSGNGAPGGGFPGAGASGFPGGYRVDLGGSGGANTAEFDDFIRTLFGDAGGMGGATRTRPGGGARPNVRFSEGFEERPAPPRRAPDSEATIAVSLEEAYNGATRNLQLTIPETCGTCRGQGIRSTGTSRTCPACSGSGKQGRGFLGMGGVCDRCGGTGQTDLETCPTCKGNGSVEKPRRVEVKIPAGVGEGQKIRLAGQGASGGPGGQAGDLILVVHIEPNGQFERKGDDLYVDVPVLYTDAALGGEAKVPTLKGTRLTMRLPAGTQSGQTFRLSGQGMPKLRGGGAGDLYARAKVTVPKTLSERERELLTELATLHKAEPAGTAA